MMALMASGARFASPRFDSRGLNRSAVVISTFGISGSMIRSGFRCLSFP